MWMGGGPPTIDIWDLKPGSKNGGGLYLSTVASAEPVSGDNAAFSGSARAQQQRRTPVTGLHSPRERTKIMHSRIKMAHRYSAPPDRQ